MKIRLLYYITLMGLAAACTQELDIALPTAPSQLVLNSLLHPDSTIQVSLTTTFPSSVNSTDFPVVDNATVRLYENDESLGELTFQDSVYVLDYFPKVGKEYKIEAEAQGYTTVRASDVVPNPPNVEICFREDIEDRYQSRSGILEIVIYDPPTENNFYWFYDISYSYRGRFCEWENGTHNCWEVDPPILTPSELGFYYSFSPIPDRFNAFVDNTTGGVTQFDFYIRVDDAAQNGERIMFDIASGSGWTSREEFFSEDFHEGFFGTLYTTNGSQVYDRYLKSGIIYHLNRDYNTEEDLGFKPFVQFSQVYSNVENGTGIFAAYNTTDLDIGSYPCE